ncbi:MAG TPA: hypothetical protein VKV26_25510 [Dehalococcoidia bacterium]|nr:hypothetical protein [Dehalococcoidia bacterium]
MVVNRKRKAGPVWWERRPSLEDLRPALTPEEAKAALERAAGSWHGAVNVEKLLDDIRWWRGHDD